MRRFGGKKVFWGGKNISQEDDGNLEGKYLPLDLAIQGTCSKGSLMKRIASLEERLVQMCLEIESCRRSLPCSSSVNTSCGVSSSSNNGASSRVERMTSYPTFSYKPQCKQHPQAPRNLSKFETAEILLAQQNIKPSSSVKQQAKLQGNNEERKSHRKWKKGMSPNWPRLKLLGC